MVRLLRGLLFSVLVISGVYSAEPFRVMTFNIRYDSGSGSESVREDAWLQASGHHRRDKVLAAIDKAQIDLLGLQEALVNQVRDVAEHLKDFHHYAVGRDDGKSAGEHCAIFFRRSRFKQQDAGTFWLCDQRDEPGAKFPGAACTRIASWVMLTDKQAEQQPIVFLNTHWDHVSDDARQYAATAILEKLQEFDKAIPVVVVGDMNTYEDAAAMRTLLGSSRVPLVDAYRQRHPDVASDESTFNGFTDRTRGRRIDYVLHSPQLEPITAEIMRPAAKGKPASDHDPVVVSLIYE